MSETNLSSFIWSVADLHEAHNAMSTQALDSEEIRNGITEILLGPGQLYETLRSMKRPGAA